MTVADPSPAPCAEQSRPVLHAEPLGHRARVALFFMRVSMKLNAAVSAACLGFLTPRAILGLSVHAYKDQRSQYDQADEAGSSGIENRIAQYLLQNIPGRRLLDVCCGGGREAFLFAGHGFHVTGIDRDGGMIAAARREASCRGIAAEFRQADILQHDGHDGQAPSDVVYLSPMMYATFPGRPMRLLLLQRLRASLAPGGLLVLSVPKPRRKNNWKNRMAFTITRAVACITRGYTHAQLGDRLNSGWLFVHEFTQDELAHEFATAGLSVAHTVQASGLKFMALRVEPVKGTGV